MNPHIKTLAEKAGIQFNHDRALMMDELEAFACAIAADCILVAIDEEVDADSTSCSDDIAYNIAISHVCDAIRSKYNIQG